MTRIVDIYPGQFIKDCVLFTEYLNEDEGCFASSSNSPYEYENVAYLYTYKDFDYMLAWDEEDDSKCIYRGQFNGGNL